jgi:hypothetical protein
VDIAAEAQVLEVGAVGVTTVGVCDEVRGAAAGGEDEGDGSAGGDGGASDVDVGVGEGAAVRNELHWWFVAQQLLDRTDGQVGFAVQALEHLG